MSPGKESCCTNEDPDFFRSLASKVSVKKSVVEENKNSDKPKDEPIFCIENSTNSCMAKTLVARQRNFSWNVAPKSDESDGDNQKQLPSRELHPADDTSDQICKSCGRGANCSPMPVVEMTTCEDWQKDLVTPLQRLAQLLSLGHLADVTLSFATSNETIKAHRLILATASPVFERMFYGDSREARTGQVTLHCPPAAMRWVLDNLYLGKTDFPTVIVAIMVYETAQLYQLSGVTALTRDFLRYEMSTSNVAQIFEVAKLHSEKELLEACVKKLCISWKETIAERVTDLTEDIWVQLVNGESLPLSEVQLFLGLYQWIKRRQEDCGDIVTPVSIRTEMDRYLPSVRLLSIPSDKFIDHVMPTNLFTAEECSSILLRLRGFGTALAPTIKCSDLLYGRIKISHDTLRFVVLNRNSTGSKVPSTGLVNINLLQKLSVSSPVLLHQIQTLDSSTLKYAKMTVVDQDGREGGVAKPYGSHWKFVAPTLLQANKTYTISIDKVLAGRQISNKDFNVTASDIRFRGSTADSYIKISFWPALIKN